MSAKMELTFVEQLKVLLDRNGMTVASLAKQLGTSRQNMHNKLDRNNLSRKEMQEIADVIGCKLCISLEPNKSKTAVKEKKGDE